MHQTSARTGARARSAALSAALLALVVAGCGSAATSSSSSTPGGSGGPSTGAVASAGTSAAPSSAPEAAAQQGLSSAAERLGSVRSVEGTFREQVAGRTLDGQLLTTVRPPLRGQFSFTPQSGGGGRVEELLLGDTIYLHLDQLTQRLGKPWAKIDLKHLPAGAGASFGQLLDQAQQSNPSEGLKLVGKAPDLHTVGREDVGGQSTTHYAGTLGVDQLSGDRSVQLSGLLAQQGITEVKADVWVDDAHLPRRFVETFDSAKAGRVVIQLDYTGYDKPVHVAAPPAGQVADLAALLGRSS